MKSSSTPWTTLITRKIFAGGPTLTGSIWQWIGRNSRWVAINIARVASLDSLHQYSRSTRRNFAKSREQKRKELVEAASTMETSPWSIREALETTCPWVQISYRLLYSSPGLGSEGNATIPKYVWLSPLAGVSPDLKGGWGLNPRLQSVPEILFGHIACESCPWDNSDFGLSTNGLLKCSFLIIIFPFVDNGKCSCLDDRKMAYKFQTLTKWAFTTTVTNCAAKQIEY